MARGVGEGRLFEGGDYFKYFRQRGMIIRGTARDGYYSRKYGKLVNRPLTKSSKFTRGSGNRQLAREIYMKMACPR